MGLLDDLKIEVKKIRAHAADRCVYFYLRNIEDQPFKCYKLASSFQARRV
jgi:hypothetical protein